MYQAGTSTCTAYSARVPQQVRMEQRTKKGVHKKWLGVDLNLQDSNWTFEGNGIFYKSGRISPANQVMAHAHLQAWQGLNHEASTFSALRQGTRLRPF